MDHLKQDQLKGEDFNRIILTDIIGSDSITTILPSSWFFNET